MSGRERVVAAPLRVVAAVLRGIDSGSVANAVEAVAEPELDARVLERSLASLRGRHPVLLRIAR
ncbi:MAG TPA: hypothetical protein VM840_10765 [Actinomycetota bacterium]|nr:hypothetical protein [Actinomycetota bacterium]